MGFGIFFDASVLGLPRGQSLASSARWSKAKSALGAPGGGFSDASGESFWAFWAAIFAGIASEVSFEGADVHFCWQFEYSCGPKIA